MRKGDGKRGMRLMNPKKAGVNLTPTVVFPKWRFLEIG